MKKVIVFSILTITQFMCDVPYKGSTRFPDA